MDAESKKKAQEAATADLKAKLDQTRPKGFFDGLGNAASAVGLGVGGGAALMLAAPVAGTVIGSKKGGIIGAGLGASLGAIVGVLGGAALLVGGTLGAASSTIRGVIATPQSVVSGGKRWDADSGSWVVENLTLEKVPDDDADIMKKYESDSPTDNTDKKDGGAIVVKDTKLYDVLGVQPDATESTLKKNYYKKARTCHPDKHEGEEAKKQFQELSEAYQILSDSDLRKEYNEKGLDGLSADKTTAAETKINGGLLFACLFGSMKFGDLIGSTKLEREAEAGEGNPISAADATELQRRRTLRLAKILSQKLDAHLDAGLGEDMSKFGEESIRLSEFSFGKEMLRIVGTTYSLSSTKFLGKMRTGLGMPSLSSWLSSNSAGSKLKKVERKAAIETLQSGIKAAKISAEAQEKISDAKTDDEKQIAEKNIAEKIIPLMVRLHYLHLVIDVTQTVHVVVERVLYDQSVSAERRQERARLLISVGDVYCNTFLEGRRSVTEGEYSDMFQEASLQAQLEAIARADEEEFANSKL